MSPKRSWSVTVTLFLVSMMAGLLLTLQNEGEYPEAVAQEFRQLITAIQQWAGGTGFGQVPNDSSVGGSLTVSTQPSFRAFIDNTVTVATGVEQALTWLDPSIDPTALSTFDNTTMFDGTTKVWLQEPGTYLIQARIRWDANAAGTFRILQMRIYGDDEEGDVDAQAPVASMTQHVGCVVRVSQDLLDRSSFPRGIPVEIEAAQDSGGARTLSSLSWFSVVKLF
jgi:hypothetical protein